MEILGFVLAAAVLLVMFIFIGYRLMDAFHGEDGYDHEQPQEDPRLNTRGPEDYPPPGTH